MQKLEINYPEQNTVDTRNIEVRITDVNYASHLGHDKLISILHQVRHMWLKSNELEESNIEGAAQVIVSLETIYQSEAFAGDILQVSTAIGDIGTKSCEIYHKVVNKETGKAVGLVKIVVVFFDSATRRAVVAPKTIYKLANRAIPQI